MATLCNKRFYSTSEIYGDNNDNKKIMIRNLDINLRFNGGVILLSSGLLHSVYKNSRLFSTLFVRPEVAKFLDVHFPLRHAEMLSNFCS